jgi:DNA-binding NarL/FixJ family response regulator
MSREHGFLVIEDDEAVARSWWRLLKDFRVTHVCHTAAEARTALDSGASFCGFLLDVDLGDGSGLDVLATARELYPLVPALVVTAHAEPEFINRAFMLNALYLCKPVGPHDLLPFVYRALTAESVTNERVSQLVAEMAQKHALSRRETELLVNAVTGGNRHALLRDKGISGNTLKTQVRALLRKMDAGSLDELAMRILRAAVDAAGPARRL